jgi:hypothetical protein
MDRRPKLGRKCGVGKSAARQGYGMAFVPLHSLALALPSIIEQIPQAFIAEVGTLYGFRRLNRWFAVFAGFRRRGGRNRGRLPHTTRWLGPAITEEA